MKKIFEVMLLTVGIIFCSQFSTVEKVSAAEFVPMANGITAGKFLANWGFPNAIDTRQYIEGPPGFQTFFVHVPAASSGLPDMRQNLSGFGVLDITTMPNSEEIVGIRLLFNNSTPNPRQTLGNAFSAIIGRNNFNVDKNKFYNAVSKVLNGQEKFVNYYSETMQRGYIITVQPMDLAYFYKLAVYAFTGN